ncbi:hypothetical protein Syun_012091 [Stephania yunnanensis]|uniref:Uncharacterized protein n=1 Tax=Stephania yunnanensis TaxID=152371 RepID=A0AAP0PJ52_9MAGN
MKNHLSNAPRPPSPFINCKDSSDFRYISSMHHRLFGINAIASLVSTRSLCFNFVCFVSGFA